MLYFIDAYDQFGKVNLFESDYYDETYDYFSIMHYDSKSFSKNGKDTIVTTSPGMTAVIGRVKDFSPVDLRKINRMYKCSEQRNLNGGMGGNSVFGGALQPAQPTFIPQQFTNPPALNQPNPFQAIAPAAPPPAGSKI